MSKPPFDEPTAHRWFAVELNNRAWDHLETLDQSERPAEMLIHAAHAACYHWLQVGTPVNQARAECLVGNVYAALGHSDAALRHASRCLELTEAYEDEMADWDFAFAYDGLARAKAAAGLIDEARQLKQRARDFADRIADPEDKRVFDQWFQDGRWHQLE